MSKLLANDAKLESKSVDNIFCSVPFLSAKFELDFVFVGFKTGALVVGCKTSPNASNSLIYKK